MAANLLWHCAFLVLKKSSKRSGVILSFGKFSTCYLVWIAALTPIIRNTTRSGVVQIGGLIGYVALHRLDVTGRDRCENSGGWPLAPLHNECISFGLRIT